MFFIISIISLIVLFLVNLVFSRKRFYEKKFWLDRIMHFLGGFFVAMFWSGFTQSWLFIITLTLLVGIFWEIGEYFFGIYKFKKSGTKRYIIERKDTIEDLVFDLVGAGVWIFVLFGKKIYAEGEMLMNNEIIISIIVTVIFAIAQAWGLSKQCKAIFDQSSGKSLSTIWFIFSWFNFAAMAIYGLFIFSQAFSSDLPKLIYGTGLVFNGSLLFLFHIPILRGLAKFKGFSAIDKWIIRGSVLGILAMIFLPIKPVMFLIFAFASIAGLATEPLEILKEKSAGVVDIKLISIYTLATAWWVGFSFWFGKGELAPKIIFTTALTILLITIFFWFRYRKTLTTKT